MKHVLLAIAAHCQPEVLKYTLGTWLETYDGSYKATVCVSLASDFELVCERADEILQMGTHLDIIRVPTYQPTGPIAELLKYSFIHANCVKNILQHCQNIPFTHVAILDNDLEFKTDFIKWSLDQNADLVMNLFDDRHWLLLSGNRWPLSWAPKCSVWNTLLSRKLYDRIMKNPDVIFPALAFNHLIYDTMAQVFEYATEIWNMDVRIHSSEDMERVVKHLWSLSFEYGTRTPEYAQKFEQLKQTYDNRFPNGIDHLMNVKL